MAASHPITVIIGDRDVLRILDFQRDRFGAGRRFLFRLRRVDVPILDVVEFDLVEQMVVEQMVLVRQLIDMAGRRRIGHDETGLRLGVRRPDIGEGAAATFRHPQARILRAPASVE